MNTKFKWDKKKSDAALALADGKTNTATAKEVGVDESTIRLWLRHPEFSSEVDRLTLMTGIALKAERLKLAKRFIRKRVDEEENVLSEKDVLDWLKYAQNEVEGIRLGLAAELIAAINGVAGAGPSGTSTAADQSGDA